MRRLRAGGLPPIAPLTIVKAGDALAELPNRGRRGRVEDTRETPVQRTAYVLAYRVVAGAVQILDVIHMALDTPANARH